MTTRNRAPLRNHNARPRQLLIPACDRCGRHCSIDDLTYDGLGDVCPECFLGGQTTQEATA